MLDMTVVVSEWNAHTNSQHTPVESHMEDTYACTHMNAHMNVHNQNKLWTDFLLSPEAMCTAHFETMTTTQGFTRVPLRAIL